VEEFSSSWVVPRILFVPSFTKGFFYESGKNAAGPARREMKKAFGFAGWSGPEFPSGATGRFKRTSVFAGLSGEKEAIHRTTFWRDAG
jgi:hypothetical protein